jgi:hypothetical protein
MHGYWHQKVLTALVEVIAWNEENAAQALPKREF